MTELNEFSDGNFGTMPNSFVLNRGKYMYYMFPNSPTVLKNQYWLISIRLENGRVVAAYLLTEQGSIQTIIE